MINAVMLMLIGMAVVFVFLSLLIIVMFGSSFIIGKIDVAYPMPQTASGPAPKKKAPVGKKNEAEKTAAVSAALIHHNKN